MHAISNAGAIEAWYYAQKDKAELDRQKQKSMRRDLEEDFAEDPKTLFDALGDDEDLLMNLCEALAPRVLSRSRDAVTEAVQAIVEDAITRRIKKRFPDYEAKE